MKNENNKEETEIQPLSKKEKKEIAKKKKEAKREEKIKKQKKKKLINKFLIGLVIASILLTIISIISIREMNESYIQTEVIDCLENEEFPLIKKGDNILEPHKVECKDYDTKAEWEEKNK